MIRKELRMKTGLHEPIKPEFEVIAGRTTTGIIRFLYGNIPKEVIDETTKNILENLETYANEIERGMEYKIWGVNPFYIGGNWTNELAVVKTRDEFFRGNISYNLPSFEKRRPGYLAARLIVNPEATINELESLYHAIKLGVGNKGYFRDKVV
ncbi:MAG: hypothetical protein WC867_00165 [Candidatus Pacearchaeota archaeon]|jgi:hypothetical protein